MPAYLTPAIAVLASVAAAAGLFWEPGGDLAGGGLYWRDTAFVAGATQGADLLTLLLILALGLWVVLRAQADRLAAMMALNVWVVYVYAGLAFGTVAFNELFPLYVLIFALSGVALALCGARWSARFGPAPQPRIWLSRFLALSGGVTALAWGLLLAGEMAAGAYPPETHYTNRATYALDLGVIVPACFSAALLVRRGQALGYTMAVPLLMLEALLLPMMVAQTVLQLNAGVVLGPEAAIPLVGFGVISAAAIWFLWAVVGETDGE